MSLNFYSQNYSVDLDDIPWEYRSFFRYDKLQDSLIKEHKVIVLKQYQENKQGEKELYATKIFNHDTKEKYAMSNLSCKKIRFLSYQKINNYKIFQWKSYWKPQKQINEYEYINGKEFLKEVTSYTKNKLGSKKIYFRNDTGRLDSTLYFDKNNALHTSKMIYTYQNGKIYETKYYFKGKLKSIDKFDCNPIGESIKKVSQNSSCINTEYDKDGNKIVVYTDIWNGIEFKTKYTYKGDSKDLLKTERFDSDNKLSDIRTFSDTIDTYTSFNNKNQIVYKTIDYYNKNKQLTKYESYNKKGLTSKTLYEYNKLGLKTKSTYQYKNDIPKTTYYEYKF